MYILKTTMNNLSDLQKCFRKKECWNLVNGTNDFAFDEAESTCASVFSALFAIFGTG